MIKKLFFYVEILIVILVGFHVTTALGMSNLEKAIIILIGVISGFIVIREREFS